MHTYNYTIMYVVYIMLLSHVDNKPCSLPNTSRNHAHKHIFSHLTFHYLQPSLLMSLFSNQCLSSFLISSKSQNSFLFLVFFTKGNISISCNARPLLGPGTHASENYGHSHLNLRKWTALLIILIYYVAITVNIHACAYTCISVCVCVCVCV